MGKCPECNSTKIIKAGFNVTREGKKQKLKCQNCAKIFYQTDANKQTEA